MDLVLILARDLATSLATPVFVTNPEGTLIYYNEPAELVLGEKYEEVGELGAGQWGSIWQPEDPITGESIAPEDLPLAMALERREPSHRRMRIVGLDGVRREIQVTGLPLFTRQNELVGAIAIFWEASG